MSKPELEFLNVDNFEWVPIDNAPGTYERILSSDKNLGNYTRMLKFDVGAETHETLTHEFWEEVYIIKGGLYDKAKKQLFTEGMYACRPPGMTHGPYKSSEGCITIEMRYYLK